MKKSIIATICLAIVLSFMSVPALAMTYWVNGVLWGNVCRTGWYYTFVSYQPVGAVCWNSGWNTNGIISNE